MKKKLTKTKCIHIRSIHIRSDECSCYTLTPNSLGLLFTENAYYRIKSICKTQNANGCTVKWWLHLILNWFFSIFFSWNFPYLLLIASNRSIDQTNKRFVLITLSQLSRFISCFGISNQNIHLMWHIWTKTLACCYFVSYSLVLLFFSR